MFTTFFQGCFTANGSTIVDNNTNYDGGYQNGNTGLFVRYINIYLHVYQFSTLTTCVCVVKALQCCRKNSIYHTVNIVVADQLTTQWILRLRGAKGKWSWVRQSVETGIQGNMNPAKLRMSFHSLSSINHQPGGRLNKKDGLTRYGNSHVKDKTS